MIRFEVCNASDTDIDTSAIKKGIDRAQTKLGNIGDCLVVVEFVSKDEIQHLKSGVLDVAQDLIISKSDLFNVDNISQSLREWMSHEVKIWHGNLLKKNHLKEFFQQQIYSLF